MSVVGLAICDFNQNEIAWHSPAKWPRVTLCEWKVMYNDWNLWCKFSLCTSTTTYEIRNMTPTWRERVRSVETPVLFFAVCGPKFTKLSTHAQERLSLKHYFPFDDFMLFHSVDIRDQVAKLSEICPTFWCFWAAEFVWGGLSKFLTQFYKFGSPSNIHVSELGQRPRKLWKSGTVGVDEGEA